MTKKASSKKSEQKTKGLKKEAAKGNGGEAFGEPEQKWRSLLENIPSFITVADRNGTVQYVNKTIPGMTVEGTIGKNVNDFELPEYHEISRQAIKEAFQSGKSGNYQVRGIGPNEAASWYEVHFGPIKRDGQVVAVTFITTDISERKQMEDKLQTREEFFRALIENSADGVSILDYDGRVIYTGSSYKHILGRDAMDEDNPVFTDHVHPDDIPALVDAFARLRENPDGKTRVEARGQHQDGNWLNLEVIGHNLLANTSVAGIVVNFRDVSERRRAREEKARLEEELQQDNKMEAIGTLAGGIAHDFNNILTGIMANISMARMFGEHEDDILQMLTDAETASLRARSLTQQLLTFAKGGEPIKKPVSAAAIIQDTVRLSLSGSNVRCEYSLSDDLWFIQVDEAQIAQVIQNLVINADQAMPEGGILRILAENVTLDENGFSNNRAGKYVRITLEDKGIGIPKKQLSKIFDPFFSTKERGRGLGLSTVFSIINRHEGHLQVDSEVGVGTIFDVYLPAAEGTSSGEEEPRSRVLTGEGKVLLVDDEEIVRTTAEAILARLGYEVECAEDGAEGMILYAQAMRDNRPFAAVIMDLTIPGGMGGKEAAEELKKNDPKARIIVTSGYSDDPVMARFEEYGFAGVIAKPFRVEEIAEVLHEVIMEAPG